MDNTCTDCNQLVRWCECGLFRRFAAGEVGEGQERRGSWPAEGARSHIPTEAEMATAEVGDAGDESPAASSKTPNRD